ncbi:acriflavin resistance protein [Aequoribacter fuscus]|uniref:Acriflavin resistance protein n=1 Tax=Aequoribacter fuscus TaxID=2518989 RepID=F3L5I2_9GAMM|nr:efflux RND transporter permease subunit [Aequoribacter fuscus]EGG28404.1 acriflavin resistance protein [Aequoribacter fuscus]QHJ87415.1 efflux RND transporter permease subunit [Aequoribacter fuscus]
MNGPIRWFIDNPIAANLLMILLVLGGLLAIPALNKQFFPEIEINSVSVSMVYPGASPREVEEQICARIEEAVHDLRGVKEIRSVAQQGVGTVLIEAEQGYDTSKLTADVKTRVDAINTFPGDAERPIVVENAYRHLMAVVNIAGDLSERELKVLGERLRDDLSAEPYVSVVELRDPRPYEVSVEVAEANLRRYGLTFDGVVAAIRGASLNLPAGAIKAESGDIRLQTRGQAYGRTDFEAIPLITRSDGVTVTLGDVASVRDGFADIDIETRFNGKRSHALDVYVTSDPQTLRTSEVVHQWIEKTQPTMPEGVTLTMWRDSSVPFVERVDTLLKNGVGGLGLVFLVLLLFLRPKLAMWVCVGIGVAFMGAFFLLQYTNTSLNMISLFAFLLILGIVVDDAIIVGESIHTYQTNGHPGSDGAFIGAKAVLKPVMYAVISTMIFFVPMLFMPGDMASAATAIPVVVILALAFSLIESLWILPPHLAYMKPAAPPRSAILKTLETVRLKFADGLVRIADDYYQPMLKGALKHNVLVLGFFLVALLMTLAIYAGGWLRSGFFPQVNSDYVQVQIALPDGGPFRRSLEVMDQVEQAAIAMKSDYNQRPEFADELAIGNISASARENQVRVIVETLSDKVDTKALSTELESSWGDLGLVESLQVDYTINHLGKPITLVLTSTSVSDLQSVAADLRAILETYEGVYNITDSLEAPRDEIVLDLKPQAENLSVTLFDLARQVREAFYGAEAQRIPRVKEDVKVMVRYPENERLSVDDLDELRIRLPNGSQVPFDTVADVAIEPGYQKIERLDRERTLVVSADVVTGASSPRAVVDTIINDYLPVWQQSYPSVGLALDGELEEEGEFLRAMLTYMGLALLIIYGLMAIPFRSYWQPFLILTAVPFGVMGAILGHLILDWQVSMFSILGVIACAGVVVNDNLVLIDRVNNLRDEGGMNLYDALVNGSRDRFRPIILTSLTTFIGLLPIMSETSVQAQFLIPMVTSLAFGVLFATGVTLVLVPCLYLFGEQVGSLLRPRSAVASA